MPTQVRILLPPPGRAGAAALRAPSTSSASRSACSVDQNATASKTMSTTPVVGARIGADEPAELDLDGQLLPHLAPSGVLDRLSEVGEAAGDGPERPPNRIRAAGARSGPRHLG